ncbi:putative ATPase [Actinocorallia herbida]|uniref:Putative ATPase n=1 Tax=Actinocorallia herbida TaxID=58109 RepID=A0A3N1CPD5_9ACTN|nr:DUF3696 domain-containing protein [Actinocorallia herbida]ROO83055.1 putative ATPase [Actinocorallia herbida]
MALLRMAVENYRCFKERQELDLRPITLILGKNNSGKSALTRLPLLLETGIHTDSSLPLDLDQLGDDPPDFLDLVYGRNPHRPLHIDFLVSDGRESCEVGATIQNIDEQRTQFVRDLSLGSSIRDVLLRWDGDYGPRTYVLTVDGNEIPPPLTARFQGLLPTLLDGSPFDELVQMVRESFGASHYLSPYRQRPARLTRLPSRMAADVGSSGENAAGMLVNDHVRRDGRLLNAVNELLSGGLGDWRIEVEPQGPLFAVVLRSTANPELAVNLLDSGTGVAQVLPLVVQQAQHLLRPDNETPLQIIEEPELHLHPAFHAVLGDLFLQGVQRGGRFLVETHSETLLLRLRRRIAEEKLSPDDLAVYFVEHADGISRARRIHVDAYGDLDYWPEDVFSEDFEETKKLMRAQLERDEA